MDKRIDQDYSDFEAGIIEELEVRLAEQKDLMDRAMISWEESGRPFLMPEEVQSWWMGRPLFSPTLEKASNKNLGGSMEVKELRDLIQEIHDSGDCGYILSDVLEMVNKICEQPSDLEIVQKALLKVDGYLSCSRSYSEVIDPFEKVIFDDCHESLLTWAKQTIGID